MATKKLNIILTGGARGIGRGLCRMLLERGHSVFMVDYDKDELENMDNFLKYHNEAGEPTCKYFHGDLRNALDIHETAVQARKWFGSHLDVLINNAAYTGGVGKTPFEELSLEEWNRTLDINLTAPFQLCQQCLPILRKTGNRPQGGSIINISSTRAHQSEPNSEAYAASKAGLIGLTHALAVSLAPMGIRVNAILPGWIDVSNECKAADKESAEWGDGLSHADHKWHPAGRVGKIEDMFEAVEYLSRSTFVTGTELIVDGGVTRKMVYPE